MFCFLWLFQQFEVIQIVQVRIFFTNASYWYWCNHMIAPLFVKLL